jgi:HEAT repeat protein
MRFTSLLLSLVFSFAFIGCGGAENDPRQCAYWVKRLASPGEAREAISQVGQMRCTDAVDPLKDLFEKGQHREDVLISISRLGNDSASAELASKALMMKDIGRKAARFIREQRLAGAAPALKEAIKTNRNPEVRGLAIDAIEALNIPTDDLEDALIGVLDEDPATQGIESNRSAARLLGTMKSTKAVPSLVMALFVSFKDTGGEHTCYNAARMALVNIGPPAVEPLIQALSGKDADFKAFARDMNIPRWKWQWGPKLVQVLSDIRDPRAAKPIASLVLAREYATWQGLSPEQQDETKPQYNALRAQWGKVIVKGFVTSIFALARFANDDSIETLAAIIPNQPYRDWAQRLYAEQALALIGTEASIDAVVKAFKSEESNAGKANLMTHMALALGPGDMKGWSSISKAADKKARGKKLKPAEKWLVDELSKPTIQAFLKVNRKCAERGTACYLDLLRDADDLREVSKAAALLSREGASDDAFNAMLTAFKRADPSSYGPRDPNRGAAQDARFYLLIGMGRVGSKTHGVQIERYADSLKDNAKQKGWYNELRALSAALSRVSG